MPGFRHSPLEDIQRIRQDLRDRYGDGFPILKELLQNADDAGAGNLGASASCFAVVLSPDGLPAGRHALLHGPGLCVLNDGDFTANDANSITSLGLSNKAEQAGAAGKFGLGLKSIFHWAEAFFYFSPRQVEGAPAMQAPGADLLNPWWSRYVCTGRHCEWDDDWKRTREDDCGAFGKFATRILHSDRWFGLWIPLRCAAHCVDGGGPVQPVIRHFPQPDLDRLLGDDWRYRLAETLPLLRRVRVIQIWRQTPGVDASLEKTAEWTMSASASRIQPNLPSDWPTEDNLRPLSGQVCGVNGDSPSAFAGRERVTARPDLGHLRQHREWPNQSCIGSDGTDGQVPEKALPHGAVLFNRHAAGGEGCLRVQPAVFLPLGEPEEVKCPGAWRFSLYLHGFFFVDAGRRHIQNDDGLPEDFSPDQAATETQVIQLWNRTLLDEVVAPLVIPALDDFVKQERMEVGEVHVLVKAMTESTTLEPLTSWVCRQQRFVCRLQHAGSAWEWQTWEGQPPRWIKLPQPDSDFREVELLKLLPALASLCQEITVSLEGNPCLADKKHDNAYPPNDEELARLLAEVPKSAFHNPRQLDYLLELIPGDTRSRNSGSPLVCALVSLANQLVCEPLPEQRELATKWQEFFKHLPKAAFIRLPIASTKADSALASALSTEKQPVALLWQDFRDAEGDGTMTWTMLLSLLERLARLNLTEGEWAQQRSNVGVRLLQACTEKPDGWLEQIKDLVLFVAWKPNATPYAVSAGELQTADLEHRLFTGGDGWAADLMKAAGDLQPVVADEELPAMLGLETGVCDASACVGLLRQAQALNSNFSSRKPLFERLLQAGMAKNADRWDALRCLLHGQVGCWSSAATLFDETNTAPVLAKLLEKALAAVEERWRRIPSGVVGQLALNAHHREQLKLVHASDNEVEALITEAGPTAVECGEFSTEQCEFVLERFDEVGVLRGLNIHDTVDGCRVRIGEHAYVDDGTFTDLPTTFDNAVTRLRGRNGYVRFTDPDGSNRLVNSLSWEAVIEIALSQPEPEHRAGVILTAIARRGNLRAELRGRVRDVAWLPLAGGLTAKPADLLHVPGAETELDQLPAAVLQGRVALLRVAQDARDHAGFDTFKKTILPATEEALHTLAVQLKSHAGWSTGLSGEWTMDQVSDWVKAMTGVPPRVLPVAALIRAMHTEQDVRNLLAGFLRSTSAQLSAEAYAGVLKHLAAMHEAGDADSQRILGAVVLRYLEAANSQGAEHARVILSRDGVRLLSESGAWKPPGELAFACNGLPTHACLLNAQANVLSTLLPAENALLAEPDCAPGQQQPFDSLLYQTPQVLRRYFSKWRDEVTPECIGAFLATLGDDEGMARLAQEFLSNRSLDGVRQDIDAHSRPQLGQPLRMQVGQYRFACVAHGSRRVRLISVLGTRFSTELTGPIRTLFLGDGLESNQGGGNWYRRTLHLAPILVDQFTSERLSEILLNSTTAILHDVYCHREIRLWPLWKRLSHSAQLHIRIAQNRVVDSAQAFLRQVGAHRSPEVVAVLREWDTADRRRAEAEEAGRPVPGEVQQQLAHAKTNLRRLLESHPHTQQATLAAVRYKIGRDYGYEPVSIPFEIWQNADDAVVELAALGYDCERAVTLGFIAQTNEVGVSFAHWGRLVNEFQGSDGRQLRDRGFDEDLEKMVVQAISDKRAGEQPGQAVTGKFGLGFKSVFLASDVPEVLSGSVDFCIRGGIYPMRLDETERAALEGCLKAFSPEHWRRGSLIQLKWPVSGTVKAEEVLRLFRRLAPLLVVFSRRLKRLRLRGPGGHQETEMHWQPRKLGQVEEVECGEMSSLGDCEALHALVLSRTIGNDRVQLLLALGADGFVPLPDDVPAFWVTAPTRATSGYGFAVNGPFEPDVGRVQLALESDKNRLLAGEVAATVSNRLGALSARTEADWDALRAELKLGCGTTAERFWLSLWEVLGRRFAGRCRKDDHSPVSALARRILWGSAADGLQAHYRQCSTLPTALWGAYSALTKLPSLRFVASGALDRKDVYSAVSQWQAFRRKVPAGAICSRHEVAATLESLGVCLESAEQVYLTDAVGWELGKEGRADPSLAASLGSLLTPGFLKMLREGKPGERNDVEHESLRVLLDAVQLQAADGSWHKALHLLVPEGDDVEVDERLRAAFAPNECRLNPAYRGPALTFFLACRPRLEAARETLANWALRATGDAIRVAALVYLLRGDLKEPLAEELRPKRDNSNWLWQLNSTLSDWFKANFPNDKERFEILAHRLRLFDDRLMEDARPPEPPPPPPLQPWTVREVWLWWEKQGRLTGDYTLEGEANWPLFHGGDVPGEEQRKADLKRLLLSPGSPEGKALWYRLFGYACLVSAGRTVTELRRFWLGRLNPEGFWERTSAGDFPETTQETFERAVTAEFHNMSASGEQAYFWRRVFYDIRKVHRMVQNDFPAVLLDLVREGYGEHLRQFLRTGHLPGPDQPRWIGTFGQSSATPLGFIIRELMRLEVITDDAVLPYAFYVCRPVLRALAKIGWIAEEDCGFSGEQWQAKLAEDPIHGQLLKPYYDIPFLHMGITHRGDKMPQRPEQPQ